MLKRIPNYPLIFVFFFSLLSGLFQGCAGGQTLGTRQAAKAAAPALGRDTKTLLLPVVQYNYFGQSLDYFQQFVEGNDDYIFPGYLLKIFRIEQTSYKPGEGSLLTLRDEQGDLLLEIQRALLRVESDGSEWWQLEQQSKAEVVFYETLISPEGVPKLIRYQDPETGESYQVIPLIALDFQRAQAELPPEELQKKLAADSAEELSRQWKSLFFNPVILGEEEIETAAGSFPAVHLQDETPSQGTMDYWVSPRIPGGIAKVVYSYAGGEEVHTYTLELRKLTTNNRFRIDESEILNQAEGSRNSFVSEGSADGPLELTAGNPHYGSVGKEGTSYYMVKPRQRADLYVEVYDLEGKAELVYYARDHSFSNWHVASEGSTLDIQDYYVEAAVPLYFTIVDHADESDQGESYTITITEDPLLSPTGIMMRGDIYSQALELKPGSSYSLDLNTDGLNYYKAIVPQGPNLRLELSGLQQEAVLFWLDARPGSYSGVYTYAEGEGTQRIDVYDVKPGTVCFFYIVGSSEGTAHGNSFELSLTEFQK